MSFKDIGWVGAIIIILMITLIVLGLITIEKSKELSIQACAAEGGIVLKHVRLDDKVLITCLDDTLEEFNVLRDREWYG